jgi:hypothetical protein
MESLHWKIKLYLYEVKGASIWRLIAAVQFSVSQDLSHYTWKTCLQDVVCETENIYSFTNLQTNARLYWVHTFSLTSFCHAFCAEVTQGI